VLTGVMWEAAVKRTRAPLYSRALAKKNADFLFGG
jgi:hypothetical protein